MMLLEAFEYWHTGSGALVFSVIGTFLLVILLKIPIELFAPKLPEQEQLK